MKVVFKAGEEKERRGLVANGVNHVSGEKHGFRLGGRTRESISGVARTREGNVRCDELMISQ